MAGESATRSGGFWTSLPGVLTGIAALLSAAGGVYAISRQQGGTGGASAAIPVNSQDQAVVTNQSAPAPAIAAPPVKVDASSPPAPVAPEPVAHPAAPAFPDIRGSWATKGLGPLDLTVAGDVRDGDGAIVGKRINGSYNQLGGTLAGELRGRTVIAYWTEPESQHKCETTRAGTPYWGRMRFEFDRDATVFTGSWGYCDGPLIQEVSGERG